MRLLSRREVLGACIGLTAAAASAYGLVEHGLLPGRYRLAEALGQCGAMPAPPAGPEPVREDVTFQSAYRGRAVRMVTLIPAAAAKATAAGRPALGVVVALHGLGGDALAAADLSGPAMDRAGVTRFAVVAADGGDTYWHKRADGDDPLGMIVHEVLPRVAARGFATRRIGIIGYSMGGYGALLLAERLGARPASGPAAAAVAAASPAIFASYPDAVAADSGAFASPGRVRRQRRADPPCGAARGSGLGGVREHRPLRGDHRPGARPAPQAHRPAGRGRHRVRLPRRRVLGPERAVRPGIRRVAPRPARRPGGSRLSQRGTPACRRPSIRFGQPRPSGERGFANRNHQVVPHLRGKHVVLLVQPGKLGFEITYSLLQAAHLRDHARIRAADVAI